MSHGRVFSPPLRLVKGDCVCQKTHENCDFGFTRHLFTLPLHLTYTLCVKRLMRTVILVSHVITRHHTSSHVITRHHMSSHVITRHHTSSHVITRHFGLTSPHEHCDFGVTRHLFAPPLHPTQEWTTCTPNATNSFFNGLLVCGYVLMIP